MAPPIGEEHTYHFSILAYSSFNANLNSQYDEFLSQLRNFVVAVKNNQPVPNIDGVQVLGIANYTGKFSR